MTPQEIKTLIASDAQATALETAGDDAGCAARCTVIAPPTIKETRLSRLGIRALYEDSMVGQTVLSTIDAIAAKNPIVEDVRRFMEPGVHPSCLPDWGNPAIRAALTAPVEAGGIGLTAQQAAPILRAAETPQVITEQDVYNAMYDARATQ